MMDHRYKLFDKNERKFDIYDRLACEIVQLWEIIKVLVVKIILGAQVKLIKNLEGYMEQIEVTIRVEPLPKQQRLNILEGDRNIRSLT